MTKRAPRTGGASPEAPRKVRLTEPQRRALSSAMGRPGTFKANARTVNWLVEHGLACDPFTHGEDGHYADITPAGRAALGGDHDG
jgi:hypothetical protein